MSASGSGPAAEAKKPSVTTAAPNVGGKQKGGARVAFVVGAALLGIGGLAFGVTQMEAARSNVARVAELESELAMSKSNLVASKDVLREEAQRVANMEASMGSRRAALDRIGELALKLNVELEALGVNLAPPPEVSLDEASLDETSLDEVSAE